MATRLTRLVALLSALVVIIAVAQASQSHRLHAGRRHLRDRVPSSTRPLLNLGGIKFHIHRAHTEGKWALLEDIPMMKDDGKAKSDNTPFLATVQLGTAAEAGYEDLFTRLKNANMNNKQVVLKKSELIIEEDAQNAKNECDILSSLDSPYIAKYLGSGPLDEKQFPKYDDYDGVIFWMVMTSEGTTTLQQLTESAAIPKKDAALYTAQLLTAVEHMAEKGIYNQNIKPANVMVNPATKVLQIVNFGELIVSKQVNKDLAQTFTRTTSYTPDYGAIKAETDMIEDAGTVELIGQISEYSIGKIAFQLLGNLPTTWVSGANRKLMPPKTLSEFYANHLQCQEVGNKFMNVIADGGVSSADVNMLFAMTCENPSIRPTVPKLIEGLVKQFGLTDALVDFPKIKAIADAQTDVLSFAPPFPDLMLAVEFLPLAYASHRKFSMDPARIFAEISAWDNDDYNAIWTAGSLRLSGCSVTMTIASDPDGGADLGDTGALPAGPSQDKLTPLQDMLQQQQQHLTQEETTKLAQLASQYLLVDGVRGLWAVRALASGQQPVQQDQLSLANFYKAVVSNQVKDWCQ